MFIVPPLDDLFCRMDIAIMPHLQDARAPAEAESHMCTDSHDSQNGGQATIGTRPRIRDAHPHCISHQSTALQDATALAEAEGHMQVTGNDGDANPLDAGRAALMRAGRRLLWTLVNETVRVWAESPCKKHKPDSNAITGMSSLQQRGCLAMTCMVLQSLNETVAAMCRTASSSMPERPAGLVQYVLAPLLQMSGTLRVSESAFLNIVRRQR